jgi:hypothetical protein
MSRANGRIVATVLACLAAGLLLLGRATAGDPDLLKDEAARRKVGAEALERDVRDVRDEAYQTARTQPGKAIERIKGLLKLVEVNPYISDDRRDALTAALNRDLATFQKMADAGSSNAGTDFHPAGPDPRAEQQKKLIDSAVSRITSSKDALAESEEVRQKKSKAILALHMDIDKADIPQSEDIQFPTAEKWIELSKRRSKNNLLTETERAILKALDATVSVDLTDKNFGGVIDWFQKQMGQTIVLDTPALKDIGVSTESTVNVHLNKVSTRTALKKVLADLGLTYVIKDETIFVTTPAKAKDMMVVRTYYIGDLTNGYPDIRFGGIVSQYQALATVGQLVQMIQSNIDPDSWETNGKDGGGTIVFDPVHMTLIVKQSAEVHYKMLRGLIY